MLCSYRTVSVVMAGPGTPSRKRNGKPRVPAIHALLAATKTWMPATSAGVTSEQDDRNML
jgi:hypothetical protein